ncbi:MAG: PIN domain-containing protein [Spirochaetaceae bacterium]|nr:PIN domain-containing protein [Spirochaetaceae bacterium]
MNVYVESNFVLELALQQQESASCENMLQRCEEGRCRILVPAYCLAEPHETLMRRRKERMRMKVELDAQLGQIARTATNAPQLSGFLTVTDLLIRSTEQESRKLDEVSDRLQRVAEVIPLDASILQDSSRFRRAHRFSPQDAIVYASVVAHLAIGSERESYFVSRDRHFDDPDVVAELGRFNCGLLRSFGHARHVVEGSDSERVSH